MIFLPCFSFCTHSTKLLEQCWLVRIVFLAVPLPTNLLAENDPTVSAHIAVEFDVVCFLLAKHHCKLKKTCWIIIGKSFPNGSNKLPRIGQLSVLFGGRQGRLTLFNSQNPLTINQSSKFKHFYFYW